MKKPHNLLLVALAVAVSIFSLTQGASDLSLPELLQLFRGESPASTTEIFWQIRFPRMLTGALIGIGLAQVGWVYQTVFQNPLADPSLLGASALTASGALLGLLFGWSILGAAGMGAIALFGALILLLRLRTTGLEFLLAAIAIGSTASAVLGTIAVSPLNSTGRSVTSWVFGSIATAQPDQLYSLAAVVVVTAVLIALQTRTIDLLRLGDTTAANLGLNPVQARIRLLAITTPALALITALAGVLAFVGLVAPVLANKIAGGRAQAQYVPTLLIGAFLVLLADAFARTLFSPAEIPLGIMISLIGGPVMFYVARRKLA